MSILNLVLLTVNNCVHVHNLPYNSGEEDWYIRTIHLQADNGTEMQNWNLLYLRNGGNSQAKESIGLENSSLFQLF